MLFQRRGCGIHVVSAEPERAAGRNHQSRERCGNAGAPRAAPPAPFRRPMNQQKPSAITFEQHESAIHALRSVTGDAGVARPAAPTPNASSGSQTVALTRKIPGPPGITALSGTTHATWPGRRGEWTRPPASEWTRAPSRTRAGNQLGRLGGATWADSEVLAALMSWSIRARCASSAC